MHAAAATAFAILFQTLGTLPVQRDFFLNSGKSYFCFALAQGSLQCCFSQPLQVAFRLIIMLCSHPVFVYLAFTFARCKNKSCFGFIFLYFTEKKWHKLCWLPICYVAFFTYSQIKRWKSILHENNIIHLWFSHRKRTWSFISSFDRKLS